MIKGIHGMFYSSEPEATRAFIRDKLQLPSTDVGGGWLIFDLEEADLGVHPTGGGEGGEARDGSGEPKSGTHYVSFYCDDIEGTVAAMRERGVDFVDEISDQGYALAIHFEMPGGIYVELYEPRYK